MTLKTLRKILTLRCAEAAELMSKRRDEPLGFGDSWALRMHLLACGACRMFNRQIDLIQGWARRLSREGPVPADEWRDVQQRIAAKLKDAASQDPN